MVLCNIKDLAEVRDIFYDSTAGSDGFVINQPLEEFIFWQEGQGD